jgi:hypothetical protein
MLHRRRARYPPGCATRLAEEGAHIAVADLDQTAAQQGATDLTHRDRRDVAVWM